MTDRFHDYIRHVPMQIGRKFLPPPQINLPRLPLLRLREDELTYNFDKEQLARREYDESLRADELENSAHSTTSEDSRADSAPTTSSNAAFLFTNEVLLPSKVEPVQANASDEKPKRQQSNFDDLESRGANIFDDLELKTIDDRAVLSQVLSRIQMNPVLAANPETLQPKVNITTNGVASFSTGGALLNRNGERCLGKVSDGPSPPPVPIHQTVISQSMPAIQPTSENPAIAQLRTRLLTKGYRENIVQVALDRLPRERIQLIEYYMKSMRTLEKVGVNPVDTLDFLVNCALDDKQKIMDYGTVAAQFVQMGFAPARCFHAIKIKSGDKVGALDILLAEQK